MISIWRVPASRSLARAAVILAALAACGPEMTSFRPIDGSATTTRPGPPAAFYDVRMADQSIAEVHVWSNGGYFSISEEPMTHVGFELHNTTAWPIVFDGDALALTVFDTTAAALPATLITSVEPLGPAQRPIRPGASVFLGAYFAIPVRPRTVGTMQIQWALRTRDQRYLQVTRFARDDDSSMAPQPDRSGPRDATTGAP